MSARVGVVWKWATLAMLAAACSRDGSRQEKAVQENAVQEKAGPEKQA